MFGSNGGIVWIGAAMTSFMFSVGKVLIGIYLGRSSVTSVYGAAGSLVTLLLWIYYSSLIFFFGAEFTQVYASKFGSGWRRRRMPRNLVPRKDIHPLRKIGRRRKLPRTTGSRIPQDHQRNRISTTVRIKVSIITAGLIEHKSSPSYSPTDYFHELWCGDIGI